VQDRDLIVGVLAAQAGFATPSEVLTAAAGGLVDSSPESLLTRLERTGTLNAERRKLLEAMLEQALAARRGDPQAVLESMGATPALLQTLVTSTGAPRADRPSAPTATEIPLERPGQYTRLGELGRGSQSIVRAARDEIVGREVALKELVALAQPAGDGSSRAAKARFLREVRLVASLDHPGIISILELARREDGTLFCAQKLIRGETLQMRLARCHTLADRLQLLRNVLDACQAMGFAHSKHVIHRDLKPSNVMVGEYGETVVVDWGLAKHRDEAEDVVPLVPSSPEPDLTLAGVAIGTPSYMSPEQARGDLSAIDARSDVFSLGAILYQLLTGRPPFEGATSDHILENVKTGEFHPVRMLARDAPAELAAIGERALRREPTERYRDAEELARELSAYLAGGRVRAYRYGAWELVKKFATGHRALTAGVAVALGALLVSAILVGIRLHIVRRDLARSFIERAHAAERESDWALAAANFAAARTQHDTPEARWGVALAGDRAVERILSVQGPTGSYTDVAVLPDGRIVVLGVLGARIEVRELDGGKVLWSRDSESMHFARFIPGAKLRLSLPDGWAFFDAVTGSELGRLALATGERPCPGPFPIAVTVLGQRLIARREGQTPLTLATDVTSILPWCAVSNDGQQVAYVDTSGGVHLVAAATGRKLGERAGGGLRALLFSSHGLVIVRQGWLDVLGGPEGEFSVALPEPAFGAQIGAGSLGGAAVSEDGHLVVVDRIGSTRADVIDLRTRVVRGILHHLAGWPRFAFSLDGRRVIASGLGGDSRLEVWRLPVDDAPTGHPGNWAFWSVNFSPDGRQTAIIDRSESRLKLYGEQGQLLASTPVSATVRGGDLIRPGVVFLSDTWGGGDARLRDVEHDRDLWRHRCRACYRSQISRDGSRAALFGLDGLEIWDAGADRVLFTEARRVAGQRTALSLSPDGRRVAWTEEAVVHVHELDPGQEHTLRLDSAGARVSFNPDSRRLAVITSESLSLWDATAGRLLWTVPYITSDTQLPPRWSIDAKALLVWDGLGTDVFDAAIGERLARFPASGAIASLVRPDLRVKLITSESNWDFRPLPQPATDSPDEGLVRTLQRTGLRLEGIEVVAAP
jgi:tRNA A-37 threonylcarbamoyl transferase component Bud32